MDADRTFEDTVADIRVPGLFLQQQFLDDSIARADAMEQTELMRRKLDLRAEIQQLGSAERLNFKKSRRYREWSGSAARRKQDPPNNER